MNKKFYITTPIYYINDVPHIGHAYASVATDAIARYHRKQGEDVFFLTGTDEHGAKIAEAAAKLQETPQEFVDNLDLKFRAAWKLLDISNDEYIRTTDPLHSKIVSKLVQELVDRGFVEKRSYEGLYCVGCEKYMKESELVNGCCPDHLKKPVVQSEENYFFKLSAFADQLKSKIESDEIMIRPESKKNEILGKINLGLDDISISRASVEWGIPFPGDPEQTIYVWIDALINYYSATKMYDREDFWPADLHIIGKDIFWFHGVIWPAVLLALDLPVYKKLFVHGYFTVDGQKMSKTIGNVIKPEDLVAKYGTDAVRYYVLSAFPFGADGDVSLEKMNQAYLKLANEIGNLFQRTIAMINKYEISVVDNKVEKSEYIDIEHEMAELQLMEALRKIMLFAEDQNKAIASTQPWALAKEGKNEELASFLTKTHANLLILADALVPFMPETAKKMNHQLATLDLEPLFPRIEE
ncbi:MAG: methionine--tRNA ligase [Candidatus Berkelbacteria bacterium]